MPEAISVPIKIKWALCYNQSFHSAVNGPFFSHCFLLILIQNVRSNIVFFPSLVLTSARLRSIKASRALITELASSTSSGPEDLLPGRPFPPRVPSRKIRFHIEAISRTAGGWNIPGGWSEGMGLVRTASGQVFKVCANPAATTTTGRDAADKESPEGKALSEELAGKGDADRHVVDSLRATAEVNHWRCSGFPLYGQVRGSSF